MSFQHPFLLVFAVLVPLACAFVYVRLSRRRAAALAASGLSFGTSRTRSHLPYILFIAAMPLLLTGLARPQATVAIPRAAGTVILVFDVSNSMAADDLEPTRLAAAQSAATSFVEAQPDSVDIGVVVFGQEALLTQKPTSNHDDATAAIKRLRTNGGTSLGQAILVALSTIVGKPVTLPDENSAQTPLDVGYWGSATIVLFSDGEDTAGPGAEDAALLAADAGVRIQTIGIGTTQGATIEVDGYQVATALNEELLTSIAETTGGSYHQAQDTAALNEIAKSIDLRLSTEERNTELTAIFAGAALLLLTIGGFLMTRSYGRIV
jgi:Ca-activated chloride channel family protein